MYGYLTSHTWTRNVRQLEDCVVGMIIKSDGMTLTIGDLPREVFHCGKVVPSTGSGALLTHEVPLGASYDDAVDEFSAAYIRAMAKQVGNGVTVEKLAEKVKLKKSSLHRRIVDLGINLWAERKGGLAAKDSANE